MTPGYDVIGSGSDLVFPESAGPRAESPPEEEISVEAAAMAYLMRGIRF